MQLQTQVHDYLTARGIDHRVVECDPALADTADFCQHYGFSASQSANALLVASTKGEPKQAMCLVLATCKLDVNRVVRKKLGVRRLSFADPEVTRDITGMELGGVTPFGLPASLPLFVDARVMACEEIVVGGGNRSTKVIMPPAGLLKIDNVEVVDDLAIELGDS